MPRGGDVHRIWPGQPDTSGYLVQNGPFASDSTLHPGPRRHDDALGGQDPADAAGGLRAAQPATGVGRDWPVGYDELEPYYRAGGARARRLRRRRGPELTSASHFEPGLRLPDAGAAAVLPRPDGGARASTAPPSSWTASSTSCQGAHHSRRRATAFRTRPTTAARATCPTGAVSTTRSTRAALPGQHQLRPDLPGAGEVQRRQDAGQGAGHRPRRPARADGRLQVLVDPRPAASAASSTRRTAIRPPRAHAPWTMRGHVFVLAANAIENAAADARVGPAEHQRPGRPQPHGPRLPADLGADARDRGRDARAPSARRASRTCAAARSAAGRPPFAVDIHNDGWGWATGSPYSDLTAWWTTRTCSARRCARGARRPDLAPAAARLHDRGAARAEQPRHRRPALPRPARATCARCCPSRCRTTRCAASAYARQFARQIFQRLGADDHTRYDPHRPRLRHLRGRGLRHPRRQPPRPARTSWAPSRRDSVVDAHQRSWDHENLYLVGGGSMPTIGTSNTTLTLAALCFRSAEHMLASCARKPEPPGARARPADTERRPHEPAPRSPPIERCTDYLHAAMQLEHATIPPYLTALYSIQPGTNSDAYHVLRVVAVEEMLHLTLAANVLNAVGGTPDLTRPGFVPDYPAYLPDGETDFQVEPAGASRRRRSTRSSRSSARARRRTTASRHRQAATHARHDAASPSSRTTPTSCSSTASASSTTRSSAGCATCTSATGDELFSGDPAKQVDPRVLLLRRRRGHPGDRSRRRPQAALRPDRRAGRGRRRRDLRRRAASSPTTTASSSSSSGRYYQPGDEPHQPTRP